MLQLDKHFNRSIISRIRRYRFSEENCKYNGIYNSYQLDFSCVLCQREGDRKGIILRNSSFGDPPDTSIMSFTYIKSLKQTGQSFYYSKSTLSRYSPLPL